MAERCLGNQIRKNIDLSDVRCNVLAKLKETMDSFSTMRKNITKSDISLIQAIGYQNLQNYKQNNI